MREEATGNNQPPDRAWTNRKAATRVPAPMREDADESDQPLDSAGTYRMATMRVPAPRLELQSGRAGPDADLVHHLMNLAPDLLLELRRGRFETTKEMLEIFVELSEKFSKFENKILENSGQATKGSPRKRVDPLTNPLKLEVTL